MLNYIKYFQIKVRNEARSHYTYMVIARALSKNPPKNRLPKLKWAQLTHLLIMHVCSDKIWNEYCILMRHNKCADHTFIDMVQNHPSRVKVVSVSRSVPFRESGLHFFFDANTLVLLDFVFGLYMTILVAQLSDQFFDFNVRLIQKCIRTYCKMLSDSLC